MYPPSLVAVANKVAYAHRPEMTSLNTPHCERAEGGRSVLTISSLRAVSYRTVTSVSPPFNRTPPEWAYPSVGSAVPQCRGNALPASHRRTPKRDEAGSASIWGRCVSGPDAGRDLSVSDMRSHFPLQYLPRPPLRLGRSPQFSAACPQTVWKARFSPLPHTRTLSPASNRKVGSGLKRCLSPDMRVLPRGRGTRRRFPLSFPLFPFHLSHFPPPIAPPIPPPILDRLSVTIRRQRHPIFGSL